MYKMKIQVAILLISLATLTTQIYTQCTDTTQCPTNSQCISNQCECVGPWILDCQTPANFMTSAFQDINLTDTATYFQTQSQKPQIYYNFLFQACCSSTSLPNYNLTFSVWIDQGYNTLTENKFVVDVRINLDQLVQAGGCVDFFQYQTKLEKQLNGQTQNLILGLSIQPKTPADAVPSPTAIVSMNVTIKELVSADFLIKLAIGIISACGAIVLFIIIFCCYRRWKAKKMEEQALTLKQKMVDNFKNVTPETNAKDLVIPAMTTCSICLGEFQPQQKVRKIVCKHIFHTECIDSWCMKNLSCPVCRLELDDVSIKNKQKQIEMSDFKWKQNSLSQRQNLVENQQQ